MSGSRLGTLRFLDITGFAAGLWAGIELDEPVGKNDGCVAGTRLVVGLAVFSLTTSNNTPDNVAGAVFMTVIARVRVLRHLMNVDQQCLAL